MLFYVWQKMCKEGCEKGARISQKKGQIECENGAPLGNAPGKKGAPLGNAPGKKGAPLGNAPGEKKGRTSVKNGTKKLRR